MTIKAVDHVEVGLSRIIEHNNKENFQKMVKVFLEENNQLEESLILLADCKSIEKAFGIWLDYIGKIVGVSRNGLSDEEYREALLFRISVNTSDGTPDIIISLVRQFTESDNVMISEGSIAWCSLYFNGQQNVSSSLFNLVKDIKPAGVRFLIHSDFENNAMLFAYEKDSGRVENFQTTNDGVSYENFQTTNDGITYEDFFVRISSREYDKTPSLRNSFPYEIATPFMVTNDGINYTQFQTRNDDGSLSDFKVRLGLLPEEKRPWTWEVSKYSKVMKSYIDFFVDSTEYYLESSLSISKQV